MTRVYRILRKPYSKTPLDGEGAYRFGGRWSSPGTRLAYTAEHLSLAMIEYFVHLDPIDPPTDLVVVTAEVPAGVSRKIIAVSALPPGWRRFPAPPGLVAWGDRFAQEGAAAVLIIPSALAPNESNWLFNPAHPDASKVRLHDPEAFEYDARFYRK